LAATALVTALAVGAFALRTEPADTSDAVPSLAGTVGAGATSAGAVAVATGPLETPYQSLDPIAGPTPEPTPEPTRERTPAPVATAPPTAKPPKPPKTPRPEPTDSWHTDWTPPPGFVGSLTVTDGCFHTDGTEQVIFTAEYDSPVELTAVRIYLDGNWLANGLGPGPDQHTGTVIVGRDLEVGGTHVAEARFFTGPYNVDLVAVRESEPFTVQQGEPCLGG
jgi:hypothetical protein